MSRRKLRTCRKERGDSQHWEMGDRITDDMADTRRVPQRQRLKAEDQRSLAVRDRWYRYHAIPLDFLSIPRF